jgi:homoserine dehydrogenase
MKLLVLGFGNVGQRLAEILGEPARFPALTGLDVAIVGIVTGAHGALANPRGIDPREAVLAFRRHGFFAGDHPDCRGLDSLTAVRTLDYDVLVELTTLSVDRRGEPAITHVRQALSRGRHVVTANKGPIAWAHGELAALARERGCALLHEATVMDGAPVFNLAHRCLRGNTVLRLDGILNATTNFVLGAMERGASLGEAVSAARRLGIAEADPSIDLDGWDAAVKLTVLANVLMGGTLTPEGIARESIAEIGRDRLLAARSQGSRLKMVCEAVREEGHVVGRVYAREVPMGHPFAAVEGPGSILRLFTDILGKVLIVEEEPDLSTTAYGVLADLYTVANDLPAPGLRSD